MSKTMTMSTSSGRDFSLARGLTFCPTERELTDLYLHGKITGEALPDVASRFIHVADIYSAEPEKLVEGFEEAPGTGKGDVDKLPVWYFFSPVRYVGGRKTNARGDPGNKSRTIDGVAGKHWWHSEKGEMPVMGGTEYGGYEQYFSYKVKNVSTGKVERAGWIMREYGISPEHGGGDLVLCKIHRSPRTGTGLDDDVPVSAPIVSSKKKRKAADRPNDPTPTARPRHTVDEDGPPSFFPEMFDGERVMEEHELYYSAPGFADYQPPDQTVPPSNFYLNFEQDPTASARPRHTVDQDEHQPQTAATTEDAMTPEDFAAQHRHTGDEFIFEEDPMAEFQMKFPLLFDHQLVAPPSNYIENVEQDFWSSYRNDVVMPLGDLDVPPCAPAPQPEDDAAELFQTVTADEVPSQNYNDDGQMEASLGEEQQEPDTSAADEVIYGMISRCNDDMMMPWQSSSSVPMMSGM